jgi:Transglycosylase SLT domain
VRVTSSEHPFRRRVIVVAASTLAVGTIAALAPTPAIGSASAATSTAVTAAGQVAATGAVSVATTAVTAPTVRTAPTTIRTLATTRVATVAPFRFATVGYNQWWAKRLMVTRYRLTSNAQFGCLVTLWNYESHWNHRAHNRRSGAHGIPQALPGSKMRSAGSDWRTNPVTQIAWGLAYIHRRYSTPCGALSHYDRHGWY